jgi:hypothetical protein
MTLVTSAPLSLLGLDFAQNHTGQFYAVGHGAHHPGGVVDGLPRQPYRRNDGSGHQQRAIQLFP